MRVPSFICSEIYSSISLCPVWRLVKRSICFLVFILTYNYLSYRPIWNNKNHEIAAPAVLHGGNDAFNFAEKAFLSLSKTRDFRPTNMNTYYIL